METDPREAAHFRMMVDLEERSLSLAAFQNPMVKIVAWDAVSGSIIAANDHAQQVWGHDIRNLRKMSIKDLVPDIPPPRLFRFLTAVKQRTKPQVTLGISNGTQDGVRQTSHIVLQYCDLRQPTFVAFIQDVTRFAAALDAAKTAEKILTTALESLPDGFVLYDTDDRLVICNERYRDIYQQSAQAMKKGNRFRDILQYGLDHAQYADGIGREAAWLKERMAAHNAAKTTVEQRLENGQWLRIVERTTSDGGRVGLRIDITELKDNQKMLEKAVRTDNLTGLLNRQGLNERLDDIVRDLGPDERLAILHIDLDKFKAINDALGHEAGDFVLRKCAQTLLESTDTDTLVARVGSDEFIVIQPASNKDILTMTFANNIIKQLESPINFHTLVCDISACIGIAFYTPGCAETVNAALTGADIALNGAKQEGHGVARVFETTMRNAVVQMVQTAQQVRLGIRAGEFEPFYQPQINSLSGEIIGFEALIRWRHPDTGLVPAYQFLPAAERAGLMPALDNIVMDHACATASRLISWGLENTCISINMSMSQLRNRKIATQLLNRVNFHGIDPRNIRVELLESTLLDDRSVVIVDNVHKLISKGFAVELDDFGTGHAAIATLRKFSVSRIKIDRSLIQNIDQDNELQVITGAIINLANQLDVNVLVEGVETYPEQETIHHLGCYCAQGYLHGRPMPASELRDWIKHHQAKSRGEVYHPTPKSG